MDHMTLRSGDVFTEDDLPGMPDDGNRYEIVDGSLIVTPSPIRRHQRAVVSLARRLADACPPELEVLVAPYDVRISATTVLQPDLLVAPRDDGDQRQLPGPPLLAVEVLSPSTRLIDLGLKRARYEAAGCPVYWVVDPTAPSLIAWELVDGEYVQVARAVGGEPATLGRPFDVSVTPADLVR